MSKIFDTIIKLLHQKFILLDLIYYIFERFNKLQENLAQSF